MQFLILVIKRIKQTNKLKKNLWFRWRWVDGACWRTGTDSRRNSFSWQAYSEPNGSSFIFYCQTAILKRGRAVRIVEWTWLSYVGWSFVRRLSNLGILLISGNSQSESFKDPICLDIWAYIICIARKRKKGKKLGIEVQNPSLLCWGSTKRLENRYAW